MHTKRISAPIWAPVSGLFRHSCARTLAPTHSRTVGRAASRQANGEPRILCASAVSPARMMRSMVLMCIVSFVSGFHAAIPRVRGRDASTMLNR